MTAFILIHGAWHGGWSWNKVAPILKTAGHSVVTPDLPGMGADLADPAQLTMQDWTGAVVQELRQAGGGAVLVGHSRGGAVISNAAEAAPALIDRLIYLSAFLLPNGQSVLDAAQQDNHLPHPPEILIGPDGQSCTLAKAEAARCFFADCTPEDIAYAESQLCPEPIFGLTTPIQITAQRFGSVPRFYIECRRDQAISLAAQRRMQATLPVRDRITLDTGHSPFFAAPAELAHALIRLANLPITRKEPNL